MKVLKLTAAILATSLMHTVQAKTLVWEDDFNGTKIDRDNWTYNVGATGWGNQELQKYTDDEANSFIENGHLVIQALRDGDSFTSARMKTHGRMDYTYGTIEARIKLPDLANGLWPAFWQLGSDIGQVGWPKCGELDIMETGMASSIANGTVNSDLSSAFHWYHESETYTGQADHDGVISIAENFYDDYHIFGMTWTPELITYWLDDESNVISSLGIDGDGTSEFRQNNFVILNLAVGGNFPGILTAADITATFPAKMYVDYVRIYDNGDTVITRGSDTEKSGKFGIYTEANDTSETMTLGVDAELFLWNNLTPTTGSAAEGDEALIYNVGAADWLGFGFSGNNNLNMSNYTDGHLNVQIKTTLVSGLRVGISSSSAGEGWVDLSEEYGLVRDGAWHTVSIPLNKFSNVDFYTIKQAFMLAGDAPTTAGQLAVDDIYWSPSVERPAPTGTYGIYTETTATDSRFELGIDGDLFVWSNTLAETTQNPAEGNNSLSYTSNGTNGWFGFGIAPTIKHNLSAFDNELATLNFSMKTSASTDFFIGMKSGTVTEIGQKWIAFNNGSDPYGFARDGQWHTITIPMSAFAKEVDLSDVSQLFEVLGTNGDITNIEIDNIYLAGGTSGPTNPEEPEDYTGVYHIQNVGLGQYLSTKTDAQWSTVHLTSTFDTDSSQWEVIQNGDYYYFENVATGYKLRPQTSANNDLPYMAPNSWTGNWTQWSISDLGNDNLRFINRSTGKFIRPTSSSNTEIKQVDTSYTGTWTQWKLVPITNTPEEPEIPDADPSASASTEMQSANHAIDGNLGTRWESSHGVDPSWLVYDLGTKTTLSNITIHWETANAADYFIQASNDNSTWTTLASETGLASGERVDSINVNGEYRYIRIYGTVRSTVWGYSIWEIMVN